jgi:hypothetical protein
MPFIRLEISFCGLDWIRIRQGTDTPPVPVIQIVRRLIKTKANELTNYV